jgi:hypothetical protein
VEGFPRFAGSFVVTFNSLRQSHVAISKKASGDVEGLSLIALGYHTKDYPHRRLQVCLLQRDG